MKLIISFAFLVVMALFSTTNAYAMSKAAQVNPTDNPRVQCVERAYEWILHYTFAHPEDRIPYAVTLCSRGNYDGALECAQGTYNFFYKYETDDKALKRAISFCTAGGSLDCVVEARDYFVNRTYASFDEALNKACQLCAPYWRK